MNEQWIVDDKNVTPPIENERLTIDLTFKKGAISESQPILSFDKLVLTNTSRDAYVCARKKYGPYRQINVDYFLEGRQLFRGYLTQPRFLNEIDQIEVKPVSLDSTDGLALRLSAIESSLLRDKYKYQDLDYIIEPTDLRAELLQLSLSSLFYFYILYTQIKEIQRFIARAVEATGNAAGLSFGTAAALVLEGIAQAVFLITTLIQLIAYAKQAKELLIPKRRTTKVVSLYELCRAPIEEIGYNFVTDIDDMKKVHHWASGNVTRGEHWPRSVDRCGNAIGAINFAIEKFSARVFVRDNTVFIVNYYSDLYFRSGGLRLQSFPDGDFEENLDAMIGTREHLYASDSTDKWTTVDVIGREYKIRANIDDPTKSTVIGYKPRNYGVSLCSRKNEFNVLERAWNSFASLVNNVVSIFGGSSQTLGLSTRIGVAKISSEDLTLAKLVWVENGKIPENHRDELSAKADELKFHWVESHVRNPRARKKIYKDVIQIYNNKSLSCNIDSNLVFTDSGTPGELTSLKWEKNANNASMIFELEDVDRDPKLIETLEDPYE